MAQDETPLRPGWHAPDELAPSVVREDEPTLARIIGFGGLLLVTVGCAALLAKAIGRNVWVSPAWGIASLVTGLGAMLFHAALDKDLQYRRAYGTLGFGLLLAGFLCSLIPVDNQVSALFMPYGFFCFLAGLLFLLPCSRNEDDPIWLMVMQRAVGMVGLLAALTGLIGGNVSDSFLISRGLGMALLGFCFLWAYVGLQGSGSDHGYYVGLGIGAAGVMVFLIALGRSFLPVLFHSLGWFSGRPGSFLVPQGLLLMVLGLMYLGLGLGICSERHLVVLIRKELASFFFSPFAYVILFKLAAIGWFMYWRFVSIILRYSDQPFDDPRSDPLIEPVVRFFVLDWMAVIALIFVVPILTMRLLSEERRQGTLEMLFTAPVQDWTVVLSKFIAAFVVFILVWLPWALFLVDLRLEGGRPFDYRPMLSFYLALACSGAGFIAMGIFFSSLTRNQFAAAIFTYLGLMVMTGLFFVRGMIAEQDSSLYIVLSYLSFLSLWIDSLQGIVIPRYLIFHLSLAVFWLFLTMKVLEARKWA
jgi:ABC-type transport system involved in multi-copper enzyme maturation permease subunit